MNTNLWKKWPLILSVVMMVLNSGMRATEAESFSDSMFANDSSAVELTLNGQGLTDTSGASKSSLQSPDQFKTNAPSLTGHYLKLLGITFLLLIIFFISLKFMRKLQFGNKDAKNPKILVLSRQYLTSKHSIWLVVISGQKYLLGITDHSINLIDRLGAVTEEEMTKARQMPIPSFGSLLSKMRKK